MSDNKILPEGEYEARLVGVCDLGMQEGMTWQGDKKPDRPQRGLLLELIGEDRTWDGEEGPQVSPKTLWVNPFNCFDTLTEKGKETTYYKVFEPSADEGDAPDWEAQIGKPCNVQLKHSKDGKWENVKSIAPIPSKYWEDVASARESTFYNDTSRLFGLAKWVFDNRLED